MPQGQLAYQKIHAKPDEFGARMAQALELAGQSLEREALDRINSTNVNDVYANQFDPAFRSIYQNFLKLRGKEAAEQLTALKQQMMDLVEQTSAALPNDYQRSLFNQMTRPRMNSDLAGLARHAAASLDQWEIDTAGSISDAMGKRIGDNIYDFDRVAGPNGLINSIRRMAEARSALNGEERSVSDFRAAGSIDKGLSDAILNEARSNPTGAKLLYDRYAPYMSSDPVRQHVLDNLLPAIRQQQNRTVYDDVISGFGLMNPHSDIDAATRWLMDPDNYKDQLTGTDQRNDIAKAIQGTWNRSRQFQRDSQSSADSSFTDAVAKREIAGLQLQTWSDPKTGLAPSGDILQAAMDHGANQIETSVSDRDTLVSLTNDISNRRMSDLGPINQAYLRNLITGQDFRDLTSLYGAFQDPVKSRWLDSANTAFCSKYADANEPNGVSADASRFFPRYLTNLDQAVRNQNLEGTQIRDCADKMLQDIDKALVGQWLGNTSVLDFTNYFSKWAGPQIGPVVQQDAAPATQTAQPPQQTITPQQPATPRTSEQAVIPPLDQAGLEWVNAYITKAYGGKVPLTDNNVNAAYDQFKAQDPDFWKNWKIGE